jgi:hypothetical protein
VALLPPGTWTRPPRKPGDGLNATYDVASRPKHHSTHLGDPIRGDALAAAVTDARALAERYASVALSNPPRHHQGSILGAYFCAASPNVSRIQ